MSEAMSWPADRVERRSTASLLPYARNSRTHTPAQVAQVAASIREWGWTVPVLVDEQGTIIAGHARVLAARQLKLPEVPVMVATGWPETKKRAYVIADNKLALNSGWDEGLLKVELADLRRLGSDLDLVGFSTEELSTLFVGYGQSPGLADPDDVPELQHAVVTEPGDVWVLGRHRVMCGDSTSLDDVVRLADGRAADLCFTSPPYAQQRDYASDGINDWLHLMQGVFSVLPVDPTAQVLVNLGLVHSEGEWEPYWDGWIAWMRAAGWRRFGWYVWDQGPGLPGDWNGRLAPAFEFVFHFNRGAERARKTKAKDERNIRLKGGTGMRRADGTMSGVSSPLAGLQHSKIPDSVVRIMRHKGGLGSVGSHPAVFPVGLPGEFITAFSDPDDVVFEPFCGAGSTLIAAEKHGRSCRAMELSAEYVDVTVRRWQQFSGGTAVLESSGDAWSLVAAARGITIEEPRRGKR